MKSSEIKQLIGDLQEEQIHSRVVVQPDSEMVIVVEDTEDRYTFDASETKLLLSSADVVDRLFNVLDYPSEVFVELKEVIVESEVMTALESLASTIDET